MGGEGRIRGRAFVQGQIHDDVAIAWRNGIVMDVDLAPKRAESESRVAGLIVPGFLDLHVHGGDGADFMDGTPEAARRVAAFHAEHGTTSLAATTLSASREAIAGAVAAIGETAGTQEPEESEIVAIHLEGPYLSPDRAGAQHRESLRPADIEELEQWRSMAPRMRWHMTIAPEVQGAMALVGALRSKMTFAIGHTNASYELALAAVERGASHFTHLFNAMPGFHHREPGPVGAAIDSRATAELIADGHHVHPAWLRAIPRLMGDRLALVTDAMRACGMPDGLYELHRYKVRVESGQARLADGTLAGSVLTMSGAVRNMVHLGGLPVDAVIPLATETPARILRLEKKGSLAPGMDADLLVLDRDLQVERVVLRGTERKSP